MKRIQQTVLVYQKGRSEKLYEVTLNETGERQYTVDFRHGVVGKTMKSGTKTATAVSLTQSRTIFETLVSAKLKAGYIQLEQPASSKASAPQPVTANTNTKISALREILHQDPTAAVWETLCDELETWPNDSVTVALDYAAAHLESWPDHLRTSRLTWWIQLRTTPQPRWGLARSINIAAMGEGDTVMIQMINAQNFSSARLLNLSHNKLTAHAVQALASAQYTESMELLDLGLNPIADAGVKRIAQSDLFRSLTTLDLTSVGMTDEGAIALAESSVLHNLKALKLWGNSITADGAIALATSSSLRNLEVLDLGQNQIGDSGARALSASTPLAGLRELNLSNNAIGDLGVQALATTRSLTNLTSLKLLNNTLTDRGRNALANARNLVPGTWWA